MLDLVLSELLKSAVQVAKDLLGKRLIDKNNDLLEKKRRRIAASRRLTAPELREIILEPKETLRAELNFASDDTLRSVLSHLETIEQWANRVSFLDMQGSKGLRSIYVELDAFVMPLRTHMSPLERENVQP